MMQLIECMKKHLGATVKVYDPFVNKQIISGQVFDFDKFINSVEMVVVMVGHTQIKERTHDLKGKLVFDTRNVIKEIPVYHL